jgi:Secretion system C-terminal sorting domain
MGAPSACGGSTTVVFTYTSSCAPTTTTCTATFSVAAPPTVVLTCPVNTTASACLTQAQLDAAYNAWLASATASGGCNGVLTNNSPGAPSICSATATTRTVTFTYTGSCAPTTTTCTATFTVPAFPLFTVPANTASTVACPALIVQPTPPTVVDGCGKTLVPTGPVITNAPSPITCEGTRTFVWTYTDCAGLVRTWTHVTTVEREPFTVPANGAATVACPANATQPTPPTVTSNCGEVLTPIGPAITNLPNPLTCEGTRVYAWTYTDCEGNTATWSFTYTIERLPFTVPANGSATVACPDQTDAQPTPPTVTSNCGEVLVPVVSSTNKPGCEGDRAYYFAYTDCEGNTATWQFTYRVEYLGFSVPANEVVSTECPVSATAPVPPTVVDNCGKLLVPVASTISTDNAQGCEGSRVYSFRYTDCEGNTQTWSKTYLFQYSADFFTFQDQEHFVGCLLYATAPVPPTLYDICGNEIGVSGPAIEEEVEASGCSGTRRFTFTYMSCGGTTHDWSFTTHAADTEPPIGECDGLVDVTNLSCIEEVPCPGDYDFAPKIAELIAAGHVHDVCSGDDITVELDSWTSLWECAETESGSQFTFGRTFYFRISDACGNEMPSLCGVTYSGACLPIETFPQAAWGIAGGEPGITISNSTTDQQVISQLLGPNNPLVIGGTHRSLTVTDAACVAALLPGTSGPGTLANCHQVNCANGPTGASCNPMGIGGMKNGLAANAIALQLNLRYNVQYNSLPMSGLLGQGLGCLELGQPLLYCPSSGDCMLRIVENNATVHDFPSTLGGLVDAANLYLDGGLVLTLGQSISYANALNAAIGKVNEYWHDRSQTVACSPGAGVQNGLLPQGGGQEVTKSKVASLSLSPNPADSDVTVRLSGIEGEQEVSLEVFNQFGQLVLRKEFGLVGSVNERLDLSGLGSGMYFVNVRAGERKIEQKLIVQNTK